VPICCACELSKPADQFPKRDQRGPFGTAGRDTRCKACNSEHATASAHRRRLARLSEAQIEARMAQLAAALHRCQQALKARREGR
jgi:hypothetical protein